MRTQENSPCCGQSDSGLTVNLYRRYLDGDQAAATALHDRFATRMRHVASQMIGTRFLRRADADDALQSAFRTFFLRAQKDQFSISQSGQLWKLLFKITERKVKKVVERHTAACRDVSRESVKEDDWNSAILKADFEDPYHVTALQDEIDAVISQISDRDGKILCLSLTGIGTKKIADQAGCSVHTVRRVLNRSGEMLKLRLQVTSQTTPDFGREPT